MGLSEKIMIRKIKSVDEPVFRTILTTIDIDRRAGHFVSKRILNWLNNIELYIKLYLIIKNEQTSETRQKSIVRVYDNMETDTGYAVFNDWTAFTVYRLNGDVTSVTEIAMMGIFPEFRGNGFAKDMLFEMIDSQSSDLLLARCLPASTQCLKIFLDVGFVQICQYERNSTLVAKGSDEDIESLLLAVDQYRKKF